MSSELMKQCPHCGAQSPAVKAFCQTCHEPVEDEAPPKNVSRRLDTMPATVTGLSLADILAQMEKR